ncbi:MAG: 4-hydroxyproline epimerase [Rhodospirillales bacterium]|jgi:4-hydroxyproline epimerase|nr:4-hydroxyproline epimerase [Rhodospirillales bacterium]MBT4040902.1 4-hydroxyproline epimerase [Rhodospirillales bacterium]MBT4625761.1 4-hydroxyproline epimerase [Rhodospirillales bacterium]MBT5352641.1 4-hydroxyproline epimerase [Rhodospirillales bacterium]MBT5521723.1 4-hydroxyproline epimerase [Rhodospirillales bacterium]
MTDTESKTGPKTGTFVCIDAHTCGNPVRVVVEGGPDLIGDTMIEKRQHFLNEYDWVRTGLMFEPRGHDVMSGSILYPPTRVDCDVAILFIEVSGCLPMCGHGTIGTVTVALERGLVTPREPGILRLDTPAGLVEARYTEKDGHVDSVRLTNIPSFVYATDLDVEVPDLGTLHMDVAYGGNFYAIVEPQDNYRDMAELSLNDIQILSPIIRQRMNDKYDFQHPEQPEIKGLSHVMWTGVPRDDTAHARNAVFYGDKAIDRSPCGTGTSARLAHLWTRGDLSQGEDFTHESIIGSLFKGRVEDTTMVGDLPAIIPSVEGWARITGDNTIYIDDRDPFAHGFMLA